MSKHKDTILKLRQEGKTYDEIKKATGASKGTIAYHCGTGQIEKTRGRSRKRRGNPIVKKTDAFQNRKSSKSLENRIDHFQRERVKKGKRVYTFHWKEVLRRFGKHPKCYLTGRSIDWNEARSYSFDHVVPVCKGGSNDLSNLGITCRDANNAKDDMSVEDFVSLCKEIVTHHGYEVKLAAAFGLEPNSPD